MIPVRITDNQIRENYTLIIHSQVHGGERANPRQMNSNNSSYDFIPRVKITINI